MLYPWIVNRRNGDNITQCEICLKEVSVPTPIKAGGPILHVCRDCVKYGEELSFVEVDKIMQQCNMIDVIFIGKESGE